MSETNTRELVLPTPAEMHTRAIQPPKPHPAADLYTDVVRCLNASDGRWSSEREFFGIETSEYTAIMIRPGTTKEDVDRVVARLRETGFYVDDSCPEWAEVKIPTAIYVSWNPLVIEAGQ